MMRAEDRLAQNGLTAPRDHFESHRLGCFAEPAVASARHPSGPVGWRGDGRERRLLEYIAVEDEPDDWLIFHAMPATKTVLIKVGLRR